MNFEKFSLKSSIGLSSLMEKYLTNQEEVQHLTHGAPSIQQIQRLAKDKNFQEEKRKILVDQLHKQYAAADCEVNIELLNQLLLPHTFTVTTGHQLCIATGPLYFIYKIASAIALSRKLKQEDPNNNYIPVFWMASEDHDAEEINHIFIDQKKVVWAANQNGAVGDFEMKNSAAFLDEVEALLGSSIKEKEWLRMLRSSYSAKNLSDATRRLAHALFGQEELIVVDGNDVELKRLFSPVILNELTEKKSFELVNSTSAYLQSKGLKAQVTPREINLFYLENQSRERIKFESNFEIGESIFTQEELTNQLQLSPEKFSPNVILRPVYQEFILPNVAYIGGPGELAYWHQLKDVFDYYQTPFPALVLRDSAILVSPRIKKKLNQLKISITDIFKGKKEIIDHWLKEAGLIELDNEKRELKAIFEGISLKAKSVDSTLYTFALAEEKRHLTRIEKVEKKIVKAFKAKEEFRINQLDTIMEQLYPNQQPQERMSNLSQFIIDLPTDFIEKLIEEFDPLKNEVKVIELT